MGDDVFATSLCHSDPEVEIGRKGRHRSKQAVLVLGHDDEARLAIANDVGHAAYCHRHDRQSGSHRFRITFGVPSKSEQSTRRSAAR